MEHFWFGIYAASSGLLTLILASYVSRLRMTKRIPYGDGGDTEMNQAVRAHANAIEHVGIFGLMALALSLLGSPYAIQATLVIGFILSRVIHAYGMIGRAFPARQWGAGFTYLLELAAVIALVTELI